MGKVDDLRAMREARYAAATRSLKVAAPPTKPATAGPTSPSAAKTPKKLAVVTEAVLADTVTPEPTGATEAAALFAVPSLPAEPDSPEAAADLCGHRAISGKTCIRENKHAEKNHKYAKS